MYIYIVLLIPCMGNSGHIYGPQEVVAKRRGRRHGAGIGHRGRPLLCQGQGQLPLRALDVSWSGS